MSDAATVYGYAGTRSDGVKVTMTGTPPAGVTGVTTYPDAASFLAAVSAAPAAPAVDLGDHAQAAFNRALAAGRSFNVAASGASAVNLLCDGTGSTMGNLAMLTLFGQENANGTKTWVDNNGVSTVVTGAQFITLATLVGTWSDDLYAALGGVLAGINANPATITTTAQIDAAFAAVTS